MCNFNIVILWILYNEKTILNKCEGDNFVGAAGVIQEGVAVDPLLAECELEAHDFGQAKLDK